MEYSLFEDVTQPGILLPLHRALTELFFVTENRAQVRALPCLYPGTVLPAAFSPSAAQGGRVGLRSQPHPKPWSQLTCTGRWKWPKAEALTLSRGSTEIACFIRPKAKGNWMGQPLTTSSFGK